MNKYTFHIGTERITPSYTEVHVNAPTMGRAWKIIEKEFPWKGITLKFINDVPYVPKEDNTYYPPTAEDRYWNAVTTYSERHSDHGSDW